MLGKSCRCRPSSTQASAQVGPASAKFRVHSSRFARNRPGVGQVCLELRQVGPDINQKRPEIGQLRSCVVRTWPSAGRIWPRLARCWPQRYNPRQRRETHHGTPIVSNVLLFDGCALPPAHAQATTARVDKGAETQCFASISVWPAPTFLGWAFRRSSRKQTPAWRIVFSPAGFAVQVQTLNAFFSGAACHDPPLRTLDLDAFLRGAPPTETPPGASTSCCPLLARQRSGRSIRRRSCGPAGDSSH